MVDFRKRIKAPKASKTIDPIKLYDTLDRQSDKGPLRPAQEEILKRWTEKFKSKKDVVIKLHTGQGKTLLGLLILQSKLNETSEPALYLCPNKFLVKQTCEQAEQFGIKYCTAKNDIPQEFENGDCILITTVQKLFNGLTKFKLGPQSINVGSIVIDDAHACIDSIRSATTITIDNEHSVYKNIIDLFDADLAKQGIGTYTEIKLHKKDAILPVPYWCWEDKKEEITKLISDGTDTNSIKFAWPLLKNNLKDCICMVSGSQIEISPHLPPLELFGTFANARHRIFMSATVTDDSFLVKGLKLDPETIKSPLCIDKEKWSGEKMILIPQLIDRKLTTNKLIELFCQTYSIDTFGIAVLTPSFGQAKPWKDAGATVAETETIETIAQKLKNKQFNKPVVFANRYDGIDLPDDSCRILLLDSKPYSENLYDFYSENCRPYSEITTTKIIRSIEQGLGRSVRGEKDYCVFIITGEDLVKIIRSSKLKKHFSDQTRQQVEIGLEIAEIASEEISAKKSIDIFIETMRQCIFREEDWKEYYNERMSSIEQSKKEHKSLDIFKCELEAEIEYKKGDHNKAISIIQQLIDKHITDEAEIGWYLQEMARFAFRGDRTESNRLQKHAHIKNPYLLRPKTGMSVKKIKAIPQKRIERIHNWIKEHASMEEMLLSVDETISKLSFGTKAEKFESAFNELATMLGFNGDRPEKQWKEGPDNLWAINDTDFLVCECKSEVKPGRKEIHKYEVEQMNSSVSWFNKEYAGSRSTNILIIPTEYVTSKSAFNHPTKVMRRSELVKLTSKTKKFFDAISKIDIDDMSDTKTTALIEEYELDTKNIQKSYCTDPIQNKNK